VRALGAAAVAAVLLGTAGTAFALGPDVLVPETSAGWRALVGGVGLVAVSVVRQQPPWRYRLTSRWVAWGALGVAVNQIAFFEAIERTGVAVGTLVTVSAVALAAGVFDWAAGERPRAAWSVGVVVALTGVAFLTGSGGDDVDALGIGFGAISGVAGALVGYSAQRLMRDRPVLPAMASLVGGGAILLTPLAVAGAGVVFGSPAAFLTVVYLGLVTMAAAYAFLGAALDHLSLRVAVAVTLLEPAVATMLAMIVLDEPVTLALVAGIALVLTGVAIASGRSARAHRPPSALLDPA
jgi:DME family drug/metabolite transporter